MLAATAVHEAPWNTLRLRVPREDRTLFVRPGLQDALELARGNREIFAAASNLRLQGRNLALLREWTRHEALKAARAYTADLLGEPVAEAPAELLYVAGHQPALFHPGVWVKNFVIGEMAARTGGGALNLIIDNDVHSSSRIRVPAGDGAHPTTTTLSFDADQPPRPWEEARIADREVFGSFGDRVVDTMANWKVVPLAVELWPDATRRLDRSDLLRDALTRARSGLERRWGTANLELPLSRLCELEPFLWFASHLFAQLPRFLELHNAILREYRRVNRVRSRTHPVPELKILGESFEAPFWVWRADDPQRRRVMVERAGRLLRLSDGHEVFATLPLAVDGDACCAVEALHELPGRGIRLRTRALTTTLFARLFLADMFVHGVGGSKYDEITDRIITRFYGLPAPAFQTSSATLHLPLGTPYDVNHSDETRLVALLRDLRFNPERHLSAGLDPRLDALLAQQAQLVAEQQATWNAPAAGRGARRARARENYERFQRFSSVRRELAHFTETQRRRAEEELASLRRQMDANSVLQDREFAFCLYPEEKLRGFMTHLWNLPAR